MLYQDRSYHKLRAFYIITVPEHFPHYMAEVIHARKQLRHY